MLCGQHWRGWGRGGFPRKRLSNLNWTCCWWEEQGWRPGGNSVCVKFEALEWFWMIGTGVPDWRGEVSCLFFFGNFYKSPLNLVDYTPPLYLQLNFSYGVCVCVCVYARALTHACVLSRVQLFVTSWTVAHQAPLPMELPRILEWGAISYSRGSYWPRQGSNLRLLHLLHWQAGSLPLVPPGKTFTPIIALS